EVDHLECRRHDASLPHQRAVRGGETAVSALPAGKLFDQTLLAAAGPPLLLRPTSGALLVLTIGGRAAARPRSDLPELPARHARRDRGADRVGGRNDSCGACGLVGAWQVSARRPRRIAAG